MNTGTVGRSKRQNDREGPAARWSKGNPRLVARVNDATAREGARQQFTAEEQIARLDARLGAGIGAMRERKRLGDPRIS